MRGYDPAEVDAHIATLKEHTKSLRQQIAELESQVGSLKEPNFANLGERVGQILSLAEEEAKDLRKNAERETRTQRTDAADAARRVRKEADEYGSKTRASANAEAEKRIAEAHDKAEAEWQAHVTRVAEAEEDFVITDAARRKEAEESMSRALAEHSRVIADLEAEAKRVRLEIESERAETQRHNELTVDEAKVQAATLIAEAKATAERIRIESENEVAEIADRRDRINAQLANVRQMLASLVGDGGDQGLLSGTSSERAS